jgi:hypothetical protein
MPEPSPFDNSLHTSNRFAPITRPAAGIFGLPDRLGFWLAPTDYDWWLLLRFAIAVEASLAKTGAQRKLKADNAGQRAYAAVTKHDN